MVLHVKKIIIRLFGLAILVGLGYGGYRFFQQLPERQEQIATAKVQRSDVVIRAFSRGELHAVRSVAMLAPNLNGTVQITRLAPVGSLAQEKDLVVEYDDSERQAALEEARLGVQQVDEQIKQVKATQDDPGQPGRGDPAGSALCRPDGGAERATEPDPGRH